MCILIKNGLENIIQVLYVGEKFRFYFPDVGGLQKPKTKTLKWRQSILTILAWVQAERGSIQHSGILANIPDVEIEENWDGSKGGHSEPSQHEDVSQHDELKEEKMTTDGELR